MMAAKARLFGDEATLAKILAAGSPRAAKALGRTVTGFREEVWQTHRFGIVVAGNTQKFAQNPELAAYLLGTRPLEDLMEKGVPGVHFYVLNKSRATALICRALVL